MTLDDFHYMMQTPANKLTKIELDKLNRIRTISMQPNINTLMQKVISKDAIINYLKVENPYITVGGFVSKASDAKHLKNYEDLYYGLRLDYLNDEDKLINFVEDGSCGVIRFKSKQSAELVVPIGDDFVKNKYPFTNHGFTSGNNGRLGVPEWYFNGYKNSFEDGAELWEVYNDGSEILRGVYDDTLKRFIKK